MSTATKDSKRILASCIQDGCGKQFDTTIRETRNTATLKPFWAKYCPKHRAVKNSKSDKRILSITIRRMLDDSPDTSYLGEYGIRPESNYSIDRAHSEDCIENDTPQKEKLERIADYLDSLLYECDCADRSSYGGEHDTACPLWFEDSLQESIDAVRELAECDCGFSGHWDNREYRYFNPNYKNYAGLPEEDIRKYCRQDFDRMESLNSGNWCYIGIRAEAEYVLTSYGRWDADKNMFTGGCGPIQTLTSGGLYGIESDAGKEYISETIREELASLKTELLALGFGKRAISNAFQNVREKGE